MMTMMMYGVSDLGALFLVDMEEIGERSYKTTVIYTIN